MLDFSILPLLTVINPKCLNWVSSLVVGYIGQGYRGIINQSLINKLLVVGYISQGYRGIINQSLINQSLVEGYISQGYMGIIYHKGTKVRC